MDFLNRLQAKSLEFAQRHRAPPTALYLGMEVFDQFRADPGTLALCTMKGDGSMSINGTPIYVVANDPHHFTLHGDAA